MSGWMDDEDKGACREILFKVARFVEGLDTNDGDLYSKQIRTISDLLFDHISEIEDEKWRLHDALRRVMIQVELNAKTGLVYSPYIKCFSDAKAVLTLVQGERE